MSWTGTPTSSSSSTPITQARRRRHSLFKWLIIGAALTTGSMYVWEIALPDYRSLRDPTHYYTDWKIRLYTSLPWTAISSLTGSLSSVTIPTSLRELILGWYSDFYDCRMDEAVNESLRDYTSFGAFFNRDIKPYVRPISNSLLVSPADGTVLHYGKIVDGRVECIKGHDYEIHQFLGPINLETRAGNSLYELVVYLAPGDYHGFHSPAEWKVFEKIHFPGYLLSVQPSVFNWIPKLFCLNERVVLTGQWRHGLFTMSAVAATNVGDITISNKAATSNRKLFHTEQYDVFDQTSNYGPGDKVGEFRLGSAIVLVFEAPSDIKFCIKAGDKLRYGQSILLQSI